MKHLTAAAAALALLLSGCMPHRPPVGAGDLPVMADPPRNAAHPARNRQLVIPSGPVRPELGRPAEMNALFFLAAGEGRKPTMLLLHGLPGNERNLDLAQAVRRAGWNVLTFTYRGAWGSEGMFSIQHAIADAGAALALLRSPDAVRTYGIDTSRIVIAGHSLGGYIAAHHAAAESRAAGSQLNTSVNAVTIDPGKAVRVASHSLSGPLLAGLILLDAWDIAGTARQVRAGGDQGRAGLIGAFDDVGHALGPITAADIAENVIRRGEEWDLVALARPLAWHRVLTVYATHGGEAEANRALARAIGRACPVSAERRPDCNGMVTAVELGTDHAFSDHRIALAREVVEWLERVRPAL